ncbi:fimbrillin family protein [Mediterranea massiliensis]|uniref:fimbrillin family protein n=1 Tax=Mediterranea massiliensis TaxID=1841865 RepID=UPI00266D50CF|nr:fimbrillin family protein [Mediterranea massiliensis]
MKKLYALIVPLCLVLGACTTADEPGVAGEGGIPMSFGASGETVGTRTLLDGTTISQDGNRLKVYDRYTPQNGTAVLYMEGTEVTCDGSAWTYSPLKYWTEEGTHSFLAYLHKAGSVECGVTDGYPSLTYNAAQHELNVTGWTIGTDNQFDFLYARHERSMTEANPHRVVEFQMSHLLCAVQFNIVNLYDMNQEISISGFQLSGLHNNQWAAIPGQPGAVTYAEEGSATQATLSGTTIATVAYNESFNAFAGVGTVGDDGCLLMWPHDAGQYEDLKISFRQGGEPEPKSVPLNRGSTTHWEAGQKYTYNLYIKDDRINLQVTVRPWITDDIDLN